MVEPPTTKDLILWSIASSLAFVAVVIGSTLSHDSRFPNHPSFLMFMIPAMAIMGAFTGYAMRWHIYAEDIEFEQEADDDRAEHEST